MSQVRAKFVCSGIVDYPQNELKQVSFHPVISGSEENKSFAEYTPAGSILLSISYGTQAANFFEKDKAYYLDFTAEE